MTSKPIVAPKRGDSMRAAWGSAVADLANECAGEIDAMRGPGGLSSLREPGQTSPLAPFALRSYLPSNASGEIVRHWMIYLPPGCLSVGGTCVPINRRMRDVPGHEDVGEDWYDLWNGDNAGWQRSVTEEVPDGEGGTESRTVYYREYDVVVHAQTSAKIWGVDELAAPARRLMYAELRPRWKNQNGAPETPRQEAEYCWGDEFSQIVATVTVRREPTDSQSMADHKYKRTVNHVVRTAISVAGRAASNFDLVWYFGEEGDNSLSVKKVYCVRNQLSAAGITLSGPTMTEVTGATSSIYAKIKTNPLDPNAASGTVEVVIDPTGMSTGNDLTWLHLYSISYNRVDADWRAQSLANVQVYR